MANCIIHPVPLVDVTLDKSQMTYRLNFGQSISAISYVWYVEGPREVMLVDAGVSIEYLTNVRGFPAREIQTLESGLKNPPSLIPRTQDHGSACGEIEAQEVSSVPP